MTTGRFREEVLNVVLAQLLARRGIVSAPENVLRQPAGDRPMPDVIVSYHGLRLVIEGKVDDVQQAAEQVLANTEARVAKGIAHIGVAVLYPAYLRNAAFEKLGDEMTKCQFQISIFTEAGTMGWTRGNIDYLVELLRRSFDQLVKEDVVALAATILDEGVRTFSQAALPSRATLKRAAKILGIGEVPRAPSPDEERQ